MLWILKSKWLKLNPARIPMRKLCCPPSAFLRGRNCTPSHPIITIKRPCTQTQPLLTEIYRFVYFPNPTHRLQAQDYDTTSILVFAPQRAPILEVSLTYFITFIYSTLLGRLCSFGFLNAFKLYKSKPTKHGYAWKRNILSRTKNRVGYLPIYPFWF